MKKCLLIVCLLCLGLWASAQETSFSDYVVGSAEGSGAVVTFYLQNVSPCFLEEVNLRVSHDSVYNTADERSLVVNLAAGDVGTYAVNLSQGLSDGWGWTVDSVQLTASGEACKEEGLIGFEKIVFGEAGAATQDGSSTPQASSVTETLSYTVQTGDSLWGIAQKHGTTVDALMQANNLSSTALSIGDTLIISAAQGASPADSEFALYTVEAGDTLWDLSNRFGTTVDLIDAANCLNSATALRVGAQLRIPPADTDLSVLQQACR